MRSLKEVQSLTERLVRLVVQRVGGEEGQLVRVLANRRHAHLRRAVEVQVRQLVRQQLHLQRTVNASLITKIEIVNSSKEDSNHWRIFGEIMLAFKVCQTYAIWSEPSIIVDHVVWGRGDCAVTNILRYQVEIVAEKNKKKINFIHWITDSKVSHTSG